MFIRKYWIPLSVFIVTIAGVGLYLLATQPPKEPIVIYKPVEPIEKPTQQPAAEVPEGDTSRGGHWHGDEWHEGPHAEAPQVEVNEPVTPEASPISAPIPLGIAPDFASMSPDELAAAIEAIEDHRLNAPEGYDYRKNAEGKALLDENGYPVIHKRGEPFFDIQMLPGFRPSPEQYAEYKALHKRYIQAGIDGSPEEDRLGEQLLEMWRTYVGPVPTVGWSFSVPAETDMEAYHRRASQRAAKIRREAYIKSGLGYMVDSLD